ncbi:hypothetical protein E0Z10_g6531 [Xylaria hypoxylon]|uniref:Pentatricopeptide repeat domain-containing protein n=1 Tax=Xylaria hypoxylon TaxID=37992 RepID=A0A4Z0YXV5_9PEZI|nr:hypothetical protein E0Z10_g6531 [Xylaria hypoxylon]
MSLGVKSLWRAQSRISLAHGFSLVPREFRNLPFSNTSQARCRFSSSTEPSSPVGVLESWDSRKYEIGERADRTVQDEASKSPPHSASANTTSTSSSTARGRLSLRRKMKTQVPSSRATPMIKPAIQYPNRRASYRSLRKHVVSTRRQALHEYNRNALDKPANDWRSTLDFMIRHTPKFGEVLDFKVGIGRGAAVEARATLSELDTNLWQIQQKHHCKIRIESGFGDDESLVLSLSGTSVSVRESLLELVRTVGKVRAVRVLDPALQLSSPELWKGSTQDQLPIQLLRDGEFAAEDETVTVYGHTADFVKMAQRPKHKFYELTTRADEIPQPALWTKSSFEQYVAKLVFARVPTHLHRSLYPVGLDHQATVVHLLTMLFSSENLRAATSTTALKMALRFIHSRGPIFRPAARTIAYQAELQHLPLDAEAFQTFLSSASRAGDLEGFNSILREMHKKGHYMRAETWTSFLSMIRDTRIKYYIMRRMRSRGLHRLQPILEELGRQKAVLDLECHADTEMGIQRLLHAQDRQYGSSWLDTITLNKMIDVLGAQGSLGACHELLDLVDRSHRVRPDHYTLNTMMTHTRSIPQKIALLSRWPELGPDAVTYQQLFQTAWKQRLPNMLRVIWRYGVFTGLTSSKMRHTLTMLMRPELTLSNNRAFLKAWEDVILGRRELVAGRLVVPNNAKGFGAVQLMKQYMEDAGARRPLVGLETKLMEAYNLDMRIHKFNREGAEISPSMRESLTIDIPLEIKQTDKRGTAQSIRRIWI